MKTREIEAPLVQVESAAAPVSGGALVVRDPQDDIDSIVDAAIRGTGAKFLVDSKQHGGQ